MKNLKQAEEAIRLLGYYQLIGGILGIGIIIFQEIRMITQSSVEPGQISLLILLGLPFVISIYAGNQCLRNEPNKLFISKINQALQVISFSLGGFGFTYHAGLYYVVGIDTTNDLLFNFNFGLSTVNFQINRLSETSFVFVNLVAFSLLYRIIRYENFIDKQNQKERNIGFGINEH